VRAGADALLELGERACPFQVHLQEPLAAAAEVRVGVVEPGQYELAAEVDDARLGPHPVLDLFVRARRHDLALRDGERLDALEPRVHGVDVAVLEHEFDARTRV